MSMRGRAWTWVATCIMHVVLYNCMSPDAQFHMWRHRGKGVICTNWTLCACPRMSTCGHASVRFGHTGTHACPTRTRFPAGKRLQTQQKKNTNPLRGKIMSKMDMISWGEISPQELPPPRKSCPGMSGHVLACPRMSAHARACPGMSRHVQACPGMSKHVGGGRPARIGSVLELRVLPL